MKTPEQIEQLANQWALDNADETMATNSALNRGFKGGYTQGQHDTADTVVRFTEWLVSEQWNRISKHDGIGYWAKIDSYHYTQTTKELYLMYIQSLNKKW